MPFRNRITDNELIQGLKMAGTQRQRYQNYLFDAHTSLIRKGRKKYRLSEDEALEAYADAILAVIRNIETERFKGDSTIKTYLTSIFFRKCIDLIRRKTIRGLDVLPIDDFFNISDTVKNILEKIILKEQADEMTSKLRQLGRNCYVILEKWALGYSDMEIAQITALNLKNATTVKVTRHRCLKKLKAM